VFFLGKTWLSKEPVSEKAITQNESVTAVPSPIAMTPPPVAKIENVPQLPVVPPVVAQPVNKAPAPTPTLMPAPISVPVAAPAAAPAQAIAAPAKSEAVVPPAIAQPEKNSAVTSAKKKVPAPVMATLKPTNIASVPPIEKASSQLSWEDTAQPLMNMAYEFRTQIPAMEVNVKVFSDIPDKRFVMLNMRKYHEGDVTKEGPVVEQIGRSGILFSYHGEVFQITHP